MAVEAGSASLEQDWAGCRVALHGLKAAPELNHREGLVHGSLNSETGRYEVHLDACRSGSAPARTVTVKPSNLKPARPSALVGRPGAFRASYDWREVLPEQTLPRGLEVLSSVDEHDTRPTIARIPPSWKLDVVISDGCGGAGQGYAGSQSQAPMRMDVSARTTIGEVQAALRKHLQLPDAAPVAGEGWPALIVDGTRCADPTMTVAYAQLFGAKVSCSTDAPS
eukprot:TRINITY_DN113126_c0_g1_i1.p1 TRINITY_DN113126_c0_g1~~TRINITY_DN113126_c0_g1_i1.p1  ORF type:complete len:224 (-),score=25.76 TRINITY_DN113126_c0_g1_i1:175-846(-)